MKKFLALCLTALVVFGDSCWGEFKNTVRSSLYTRYESMKCSNLFNYSMWSEPSNLGKDAKYALKTQERWEKSENVQNADIRVWVDERDDNVLHIQYKGKEEQTLKFDELKGKKEESSYNDEIYIKYEPDKWLGIQLYKPNDSKYGMVAEFLWYKGAVILETLRLRGEYGSRKENNSDLSFALLANNTYIQLCYDPSYRRFNKITLAARNELWNLLQFNPNNSDVCQLISYRIYNFDVIGSTSTVEWNQQDLFFSKFYKEIAWQKESMDEGFFSCNFIDTKNPVTIEDLSVSLYRRAHFSEINQVGEENTRSISIAPLKSYDDGRHDDIKDYWLQYLYPVGRPIVKIEKLTGTQHIGYNKSDAKNIELPEVDKNCKIANEEEDYILPKDDIRRLAHNEAANCRDSLDFVRDKNGDINIILPSEDSKTTFNDGFEIKEGYKTQIQCGGEAVDVEFDLVMTSDTCRNDTGSYNNITKYVFYWKLGNGIRRPFSFYVDDILNDKLEAYINKKIEESQSNPTPPANESNDEPSPTEEPGKSEQQSQENQPPTETSKKNVTDMSFAEKVKFFNEHGHALK